MDLNGLFCCGMTYYDDKSFKKHMLTVHDINKKNHEILPLVAPKNYYYCCTNISCPLRFKMLYDFIKHMKKHNVIIDVPMLTLFNNEIDIYYKINDANWYYLCPELDCGTKLRSRITFYRHMYKKHDIDNIKIPKLVFIENKKMPEGIENRAERFGIRREEKNYIKELAKKQIESDLRVKIKTELEFKIRKELEIKIRDDLLAQIKKEPDSNPKLDNNSDCSICLDNKADTAINPCGHKMFCYDCINDYKNKNMNKKCPICHSDILSIIKIFS